MKKGVREIAKLAGVSIGTVSNVMNRPELVSQDTIDKVRAAMETLGYQPGSRKKGRRVLAFTQSVQGRALLEKVERSGLEVAELDLSDESKRERLLRYLLNNKTAAAALLIVTQSGAIASEISDLINLSGGGAL